MDDVSDDEQVDKETEYMFYITLNCKKNLAVFTDSQP